jgi:hypothetical protein
MGILKWVLYISILVLAVLAGWYIGGLYSNKEIGAVIGGVIGFVIVGGIYWYVESYDDDDLRMTY